MGPFKTLPCSLKNCLPICYEKSVLVPAQMLTFLGFVLNSVTMTVQLTTERKDKLENACQKTSFLVKSA